MRRIAGKAIEDQNGSYVELVGVVAAEVIERNIMGLDISEIRVQVGEGDKKRLPLPVRANWLTTTGTMLAENLPRGTRIRVIGTLERRFYRSGAGARSLMEVHAAHIEVLHEDVPKSSLWEGAEA